MKRGKYKDFVWIIALCIFAIFLLEGAIYYSGEESVLLRFTLNLQNAVKAYALSPEIKADAAFNFMRKNSEDSVIRIVAYLYCVGIILAPFCTAAAVTMLIRRPLSFMLGIFRRDKEKEFLIIGDGAARDKFVEALNRDCRVTTLERGAISDEKSLEYMKNGIRRVRRFDDMPQNTLLKRLKPLAYENILLCSEDGCENIRMLELILTKAKQPGAKICTKTVFVTSGNAVTDELMRGMYDKAENKTFELKIVDVNCLMADRVLSEHPIYEGMKNIDAPVHIGVIGFGDFGQAFLVRALNDGVMTGDKLIRADVFDKDMPKIIGRFMKRFSSDILDKCFVKSIEEGITKYTLRLSRDNGREFAVDGEVIINFFTCDTGTLEFTRAFKKSENELEFNYIAVAISDGEPVSNAVTELGRLLKSEIPVIVRAGRSGAGFGNLVKNVSVYEKTYSYDALSETGVTEGAMEFNCRYELISASCGTENADKLPKTLDANLIKEAWNKKSMFDRDSSLALSRHQAVKIKLLNSGFSADKDKEALQKIEHRRWNIFMITNGYAYAPQKDRLLKTHPCISVWEELKKEKPETLEYDFIPYKMYEPQN